VYIFELRDNGQGLTLSGGPLTEPLVYPEPEPEAALRVVGFISQQTAAELRIFDQAGKLIETRIFNPTTILPGAVGGLEGPSETP